jgi:alpha-galactosidase
MKYFGYFVTESSYHMSEYLPYFRKKKDLIAKINVMDSWLKNSEGSYLKLSQTLAGVYDELIKGMMSTPQITRTNEYASVIINAMETGTPVVVNGNVENAGLITNLPSGACVELPCLVDAKGIKPTFIGDLPVQCAALNRTNINIQELAVIGALNCDKDAIRQAIMMDPLTSAILTLPEIEAMTGELFEAHKVHLAHFF